MYKPKKYVRLDLLPRMPRLPDIRNLLNEAKKARACTVELPWRSENLGLRFSLTVRVEVGGGEPIWTLYEGEGSKSRVMWSTGFNEVELLYDVLTLSLPTEGPNIFAPYQDKPKEEVAASSAPAETFSRSYEKTGGDAAPSDFYKPTDSSSSNAALNAEYANFLMTEEPVAVTPAKAPTEEIEKPRQAAAMTADIPVPDLSAPAAPPAAPVPAPVPPGYPQMPYPYPPQPGYGYPPGYPYGQQMPPNYNYPPGYSPGPGYPAGYPYGQMPYPYPPGQPGYPQQNQPGESLSAASTVPLSPGAAPGYTGNPADPYASHVVAPHPDLVKKRPNVMLGSFLVDAGLVPKATIDAALQVQALVSQGTLSAMKAAEAVRRAHIRGGSVEPDAIDGGVKPNEMVVRVKPQIGQVLVMAGIISAAQLKTALSLQDVLRSGNMAMEEAVRTLAQTLHVKDEIKPGQSDEESEEIKQSLGLLTKSGLLPEQDLDAALKIKADKGGQVSRMLVASGKLDKITLDAAISCQRHLNLGKLKLEQIVPALHYCQRMRVSFEEAAAELGLNV